MEWYAGHCRTCGRGDAEDLIGERLGVPRRKWLAADGSCESCGKTWPDVSMCHKCGGEATPGSRWRELKAPDIEAPTIALLVQHAIRLGRIEFRESGSVRRAGVRRLLNKLNQRTPYYDAAWTELLTDWQTAFLTGQRVAHEEMLKIPAKQSIQGKAA